MHWQRWSKTGDPGEAAERHSKLPDECTIQDCEKRPKGRGLCGMHWWRWRHLGDPEAEVAVRILEHPDTCTIEECDRPYATRGLCGTHYMRLRMHGDPHTVLPTYQPTGEASPSWVGDDASYSTVHWRLRHRQPAKNESCRHCGGPASDWAYDHQDPNEKVSERGLPYSTDLNRYMPLCRLCHKTFDNHWIAQGAQV